MSRHRSGVQRTVVTTAAATTAWLIGSAFSEVDGLVAAIVAVLTLRISLQDSLSEGLTQILATALGIGVAFASLSLIGDSAIALAVTVLLSLLAAALLRVGEDARISTVVTSLIVMGPGLPADTAGHRAWGTVIGVAVALGASPWAHPLTPAQRAERRIADLGSRAGDLLAQMASGVREGVRHQQASAWLEAARVLDREVEDARPIVETAQRYARWSPWASREEASAVSSRFAGVEHLVIQTRILARTFFDATTSGAPLGEEVSGAVGEVLDAASEAVLEHADGGAGEQALGVMDDAADAAAHAMKNVEDTQELILGAGVITTVRQMAGSLDHQSPAITEVPEPPPAPLPVAQAVRTVVRPLRRKKRPRRRR